MGQTMQARVSLNGASLLFLSILASVPAAWAEEELAALQADFLRGEFERVLQNSGQLLEGNTSVSRDELLYLRGVAALKLGEMEVSRDCLGRLVKEHPESRWIGRAKALLEREDFSFSVQVGAFGTKANAKRLKAELERRGYQAAITETALDGRRLHRVRVGRYAHRQEAQEEAQRLKSEGFPARVVP